MAEIKKLMKNFGSNVKKYVDYIMKLGFGELFIQFLILVIILVLACFVYVPVGLVQDLIWNIVNIAGNMSVIVFNVYNVIFGVISFILAALAFMYLFNKRYDDVQKEIKEQKNKKEVGNIDLPKCRCRNRCLR